MSMVIERIMKQANEMGACKLTQGVDDMERLCNLFYKPQGREFCIERNFPTLADFCILRANKCSEYGVYVDSGHIKREGGERYGLIGKTDAELTFSGVDRVHLVILMHGAKATINISNYAVVRIERTPECEVVINDTDKTGVVLW